MHFEILVEDISGKTALDIILPKILGDEHTFIVHSYKGIGRIPPNLTTTGDASKRVLLEQLPRLIRGYGLAFASYPQDYPAAVFVVCDLDNKCLVEFRNELLEILNNCFPAPETRFCIAVEEGEAWFLGDLNAVKTAYPNSDEKVLNKYVNDSICGTWEVLADAVHPGGKDALQKKTYYEIGAEKISWAENISPHMNIDINLSPSFCYFIQKLRDLI